MIVFKEYSVDRNGEMKHVSEYSSEEWVNARDRRNRRRKRRRRSNTKSTTERASMKIYPVILSGGAGTRLWPLSRAVLPKQLLPLVSDKTMLQETALRVADWPELMAPVVVCGNEHRFLVAEQMREIGVAPLGILLEPAGRNTAPAVAAAAHFLAAIDPEAVMLVLPADHVIEQPRRLRRRRQARRADGRARARWPPSASCRPGPETGYGYIHRGAAVDGSDGCFQVDRFVEKPDRATAAGLPARRRLLLEQRHVPVPRRALPEPNWTRFTPEIAAAAEAAVRLGYRDLDFCRLDEASFNACPSDSIDYAVMERTEPRRGGAGRHRLERRRFLVGAVGSAAARRRRQRPARRRLPRRRDQFAGARREPHRRRDRRART